jgi:hypothetical protein
VTVPNFPGDFQPLQHSGLAIQRLQDSASIHLVGQRRSLSRLSAPELARVLSLPAPQIVAKQPGRRTLKNVPRVLAYVKKPAA